MKSLFTVEMGNPEKKTTGRMELCQVDMPQVGAEDVLIKVAYASICGSDGHVLGGNLGPLTEYVRSRLPMSMGHEISGVIAEVGATAAAAGYKVGDRVTANYTHFCNSCHNCHIGLENHCLNPAATANAMSEYVSWRMSQIFKIPDDVGLDCASLTEPLSIAFGAVEMAQVKLGSRVAIFGGGGIGLMAVQLAKMAGASRVVLMEPVEAKRKLGMELGADAAWNPIEDNIEELTQAYTGGLGFDAVIEASGASSAAATALQILSKDGHVVYFAMYKPDFNLSVNLFDELYLKQKHLHGMYTTADVFPRVVSMLGRVNLKALIHKVYGLDDYEAAFADQLSGNYAKIIFKCNDD